MLGAGYLGRYAPLTDHTLFPVRSCGNRPLRAPPGVLGSLCIP
jgi:hypothetical protein